MTDVEQWRLAEYLSVVQASVLIADGNPSRNIVKSDGQTGIVVDVKGCPGFDAAFSAVRQSIVSGSLEAILAFDTRPLEHKMLHFDGKPLLASSPDIREGERAVIYDDVLRVRYATNHDLGYGNSFPVVEGTEVVIKNEPNWFETTLEVNNLKDWLASRQHYPAFFFPNSPTAELFKKENPRYSPKLACAVAAWNEIKEKRPGSSVKKTVSDWATEHYSDYLKEGWKNSDEAANEISRVVNWDPKGGSPPTPGGSA